MSNTQLKGAFAGCTWCHGKGCLCCDREREKAYQRSRKPILSVTHEELADPTLGPLIKNTIGADAMQKAFGPDGGGVGEINSNCAVVSLVQALRKHDGEDNEETAKERIHDDEAS